MNGSLTEKERLGLEDVFLSISSTPSARYRWSRFCCQIEFKPHIKKFGFSPKNSLLTLKESLKDHKITKLFIKNEKRRKI